MSNVLPDLYVSKPYWASTDSKKERLTKKKSIEKDIYRGKSIGPKPLSLHVVFTVLPSM